MQNSDEQWEFLKDFAKLIQYIELIGMKATGGELWRPDEMQKLYFFGYTVKVIDEKLELVKCERKSKTTTNRHGDKTAGDLNIFYWDENKQEWILTYEKRRLEEIGTYWKSLNEKNIWGGDWDWDAGHFERQI